jgi:hypothetical protein
MWTVIVGTARSVIREDAEHQGRAIGNIETVENAFEIGADSVVAEAHFGGDLFVLLAAKNEAEDHDWARGEAIL